VALASGFHHFGLIGFITFLPPFIKSPPDRFGYGGYSARIGIGIGGGTGTFFGGYLSDKLEHKDMRGTFGFR